jgi:hypothetical protein
MKNDTLWNTFPRNPTQTKYFRFLKGPDSEIKTMFTDSVSNFNKKDKDLLKTRYSEFMEKIE